MEDNLFVGLPPPLAKPLTQPQDAETHTHKKLENRSTLPPPILKGGLKREKPTEPQREEVAPQKRLRFKMTVDASEKQVAEAMDKIASHIGTPSKFSKASKLALQLIQADSVKPETGHHFFAILEAAMSSKSACTEPALRADYHALFTAAQDVASGFSPQQKNQLSTWTIRAVVGNDLYTDDSFVFSKAAARVREAISSLPNASEDDDMEEAIALAKPGNREWDEHLENGSSMVSSPRKQDEFDPFGLDALLPSLSKKDEKARGKKDAAAKRSVEEEELKRSLKSTREALISCLEIAARRYNLPWAQTVIDILVKHAFDNVQRFTARQRDAIEKLWASIREKQTRRKQGKSTTGKLDMNAFEWLQEKYSNEKISIRHAVGGGGDRRAQQWLG
ncbi:uncharacterized protein LOC18422816 [Amborella trichopoda]|uniref:Uncharacterized protein n=1 Tax=Amborella trichopoda TaxID=13333 RepID=W1NHH2_AMBTC|nr:uncharacterized protein LOC18422816 [Amborella trichopoda]ERM94931.1 hypothetical protein AMTR_s00009p00186790 [Amborella trichopoda]|eukprot:XP_006827515.1 uncharacterized protein LOC18422816 [Amborella trichopoda]